MARSLWMTLALAACTTGEGEPIDLPLGLDDGAITLPEDTDAEEESRWQAEDAHVLVRTTDIDGRPVSTAQVHIDDISASANDLGLARLTREVWFAWPFSVRISAPGYAETLTSAWLSPGGTTQLTVPLLATQDFVVSTTAASSIDLDGLQVVIPENAIVAPDGEQTPSAAFTSVLVAHAPEVAGSLPDLFTEDWSLLNADLTLHVQVRELAQKEEPTAYELAQPFTAIVQDAALPDGIHELWHHNPDGPWWSPLGEAEVVDGELTVDLPLTGWFAIGHTESYEELGCIAGTLADTSGNPLGGVRVGLVFPDGISGSSSYTWPDGSFCLTAEAQGTHQLMTSAESDGEWVTAEASVLVDQDIPGACFDQTCQAIGTVQMVPGEPGAVRIVPAGDR